MNKVVERPWGTYECILTEEKYQVKRLIIKPMSKLSLQYHKHRSEHWTVVRGILHIQIGEDTHLLQENQSIYVPTGVKHRIINNTYTASVLIETQIAQNGGLIDEADIVRLEDDYGRVDCVK